MPIREQLRSPAGSKRPGALLGAANGWCRNRDYIFDRLWFPLRNASRVVGFASGNPPPSAEFERDTDSWHLLSYMIPGTWYLVHDTRGMLLATAGRLRLLQASGVGSSSPRHRRHLEQTSHYCCSFILRGTVTNRSYDMVHTKTCMFPFFYYYGGP